MIVILCTHSSSAAFADLAYARCRKDPKVWIEEQDPCLNHDPIDRSGAPGNAVYPRLGGAEVIGVPSNPGMFSVADAPTSEFQAIPTHLIGWTSFANPTQRVSPRLHAYTVEVPCKASQPKWVPSSVRRLLFASVTTPLRTGFTCFDSLAKVREWAALQPGMSPQTLTSSVVAPEQPLINTSAMFEIASVKLTNADVAVACHRVTQGKSYEDSIFECHHGIFDTWETRSRLHITKTQWYEAKTPGGLSFGIGCHFYELEKFWVGTACHMIRNDISWQSDGTAPPSLYITDESHQ